MSVSSLFAHLKAASKRSVRRSAWRAAAYSVLALPSLSGCVSLDEYLAIQSDVRRLEKRLDAAEKRAEESSTNIRSIVLRAFCPSVIGELIRKVKKVCQKEGICIGESVSLALLSVDPSSRGHFLTLTKTQPHVAIYWRTDQETLSDLQRKELRHLLKPPWFEQTHFLIVASPDPQENADMNNGVARLKKVAAEITTMKFINEDNVENYVSPPVPQEKILKWVFPFVNRTERVDPKDAPKNSNETLYRSVWVFRVDCDT